MHFLITVDDETDQHMPPPPVEFQTPATNSMATTQMQPSQSVHLTSRLNTFLKSLQSTNWVSPSSTSRNTTTKKSDFNTIRNEFEMRSLAAAAAVNDQRPPLARPATRQNLIDRMNQSCPITTQNDTTDQQVHTQLDQTNQTKSNTNLSTFNTENRQRTLKLDRVADINPMRLNVTSRFQCRINDKLDENGTVWVEIIYADDEEMKFKELFKLLNLRSNLSVAPKFLYIGKYVSALYKKQWQRAVVIDDLVHDCSMIKIRYLDTGRIRFVDRLNDLREVDEKFFNAPNKALHCTIRLNKSLRFTNEMREFFSCIVFKKLLNAKVIALCKENYRELWQIELICEVPNGYVNIYAYLLSKFNRVAYEAYKTTLRLNQKKFRILNETSVSSSSTYTESGVVSETNERFNNAVYSTDMYRLDTLNEQSIYSLDTNMDGYKDVHYHGYQLNECKNSKYSDDDDNVSMSVDEVDDCRNEIQYGFCQGMINHYFFLFFLHLLDSLRSFEKP
jgi:hypothetical protein